MSFDTWTVTTDPAWPWSLGSWGTPALLLVALLLMLLTFWTYHGVAGTNRRRIGIVIALRLAALLLAVLAIARPSFASRDSLKVPSTLIILLDGSQSMTIQDEYGNLSRWDAMQRLMSRCGPLFDQLHDEQNVTVRVHRFAEGVGDYDPQGKADGKRTDFGTALHDLAGTYAQEPMLRGLVVLSDGGDNGSNFVATAEAEQWRRKCPVTTFALGKKTTSSHQSDIRMVSIVTEPSPVPVKGKLTVRVVVDAPGFEGRKVPIHLFIEEPGQTEPREVKLPDAEVLLPKALGNEIKLETTAPATPGEIKLTVKIDPQDREVIRTNNDITTYVTVAKEGLSVLYVEGKHRAWEPKMIREALKDPRIRLTQYVRTSEARYTEAERDLFNFEKQRYDVLIVGDISARRLCGGDQQVMNTIRNLVSNQGMGIVFIGGYESYGNSDWQDYPALVDLLPVRLDEKGQVDEVRMLPTEDGLRHYVLRLSDKDTANADLWAKLPKVAMTRLGTPKAGAKILARADNDKTGKPMLVAQDYGKGRSMAFATDQTWMWWNLGLTKHPPDNEGQLLDTRFWKQSMLYLAHQEESGDDVWINLDSRLLAAGSKLGFSVGARGKKGEELPNARFEVSVTSPQGNETAVTVSHEPGGNRGSFTKTEVPGEYRVTARAFVPKSGGGEEKVGNDRTVRFLVVQDTAELSRQAADPDFLERLSRAGGGKSFRAEDLPRFLQEMKSQPMKSNKPKTDLWPDWRRTRPSPFLMVFYVLFVALIGLEWFLRRTWGMV